MKLNFLSILPCLILFSFSKSMAQTETKTTTAVLNHIAVYVSDLKTSTDFYEQVFNLEKVAEPFKDGRHTWFSLGAAGHLHLIQGKKDAAGYDKNEHLCFSVPDVAVFIGKLKSKNILYENWAGAVQEVTLRVDGVKQIYFKDPDGHWLEVNDAR